MKAFGEFTGCDRPRGACEAIALQRVPADLRRLEADLMGSKWFDYRLWHPVVATSYWAHCYREAVKSFCAQTQDREKATELKVFSHKDPLQTRDFVAAHIARQHLDRIGCRYDWALTWLVRRHIERGWARMPRPNQLYAQELMLDVQDAWAEECAASLQIAKSDHFRVGEGPLQPVQAEYVAWLVGQVRQRTTEHWRPVSRLLGAGVLPERMVEASFGAETLRRAKRVVSLAA